MAGGWHGRAGAERARARGAGGRRATGRGRRAGHAAGVAQARVRAAWALGARPGRAGWPGLCILRHSYHSF